MRSENLATGLLMLHLAKMIVYKREGKDQPVTLGLYEHEGSGWLAQLNGPEFEVGQWYHMRMSISDKTAQVQIWKEGDAPSAPQSFTVSPTPQQTLGVISSGASIEYRIVTPDLSTQIVPQLRPSNNLGLPTEKDREIAAQKQLQTLNYPKIGSFNLEPVNKALILKGLYLYRSNGIDQNKLAKDYLVLGQTSINQKGQRPFPISGQSPIDALQPGAPAPALVSLITQKAYDTAGNQIATCPNVLEALTQVHGALPDAIQQDISTLRNKYAQTQLAPFKFGSIQLQATSADDITQGHFIYKAVSPAAELRDKQGNPAKNAQGVALYDYFLMNSNGTLGVPYGSSVNSIRSLVTDQEYNQNSTTPTGRYRPMLEKYQENTAPFPSSCWIVSTPQSPSISKRLSNNQHRKPDRPKQYRPRPFRADRWRLQLAAQPDPQAAHRSK